MKIFKHAFHLLPVVFCFVLGFLWPVWLIEGYLDGWYLKIATFVSVYGGFAGSLVWYIQNRKGF